MRGAQRTERWEEEMERRSVQRWETVAQVAAAREAFEARLRDWRRPVAHGLVVDGEVTVWNRGSNPLSAVVLATVLGHDGSTAALSVDESQLGEAIELIAPAEACDEYDHPNLRAWRAARGRQVTAVFIGDETLRLTPAAGARPSS